MRSSYYKLLLIFALFFYSNVNSQNQTNAQRLQQLPPGNELRLKFDSLSPQAKLKAENWLNNFDFPDQDFKNIDIDDEGGVFYFDPINNKDNKNLNNIDFTNYQRVSASEIFTLHSKPNASKVVHLDFDGHNINGTAWNNSTGRTTLFALPYDSDGNISSFSTSEIDQMAAMWHRVAEDFAPFDIDVTTEPPTSGYGPNVGHILVTHRTDSDGYNLYANSAGGVAYVNVWGQSNFTYYQPALVFYNHLGNGNIHNIAEASSHELGHNLALSHDGNSTESYYAGHGSGNISWAPIMGVGYYKNVTQWSNGNYIDANNTQDDLNLIANRLGYSDDDHANAISNATELNIETDGTVNVTNPESDPINNNSFNKGIIETSNDLDMFLFNTYGGLIDLNIRPSWEGFNYGSYRGSNLDVKATLYNSNGNIIGTYSLSSDTYANVNENLAAGAYYLGVEGESSSNYNNYGSIGQYFISGTIEGGYTTPTNLNPVADYTTSINERTISFTDLSTDDDGNIVSWLWNFGDGNTSTQQNPVHTYLLDDTFSITLTVTDNNGGTANISQDITICLDTDGDTVCDSQDVCPGSDDTIDSDSDDIPDNCDSCPNDPNNDADGDGICGDLDICPGGDDNIDSDGDGIPDFCDSCNDLLDSDGDGIKDCNDQEINSPCPNNVDANGISIDNDGDNVPDCLDICPGGDDNIDSDGDGIPDFCETPCIAGTTDFINSTLTHTGSGSSNTSVTIPTNGQDISFIISDIDQRTGGKPTLRYIEEVTVNYIDNQGNNQFHGVYSGSNNVNISISGIVQSVTINLTDGYDGNTNENLSIALSSVSFCVETVQCNDDDGDGICNEDDQCPGFDDYIDNDGDGIPDNCDPCDDTLDSDGDGVSDCIDLEPNSNCPNIVDSNGISLDTDNDGVCDEFDICPGYDDYNDTDNDNVPDGCDICPGYDDSIDSDNDGIPDGCDLSNCSPDNITFETNPLTHLGTDSSSTSLTLPINSKDISFTVSGINQRTGGKPSKRFIEQITIDYIDSNGNSLNYGVFSNTSSITVTISEIVQSITVSLSDGYDGDSDTLLSVDLTEVEFCMENGSESSIHSADNSLVNQEMNNGLIKVFPNPASRVINISLDNFKSSNLSAEIFNIFGKLIVKKEIDTSRLNSIEVDNLSDGLYMLIVKNSQGESIIDKKIVIKK